MNGNSFSNEGLCIRLQLVNEANSPWAKTPKIRFFVPCERTSAIMYFLNLQYLKFILRYDSKPLRVAFLL